MTTPEGARAPRHGRPARRTSAGSVALAGLGVVGELLITAGVLLLAFLVWQLWWTDVEGNRAQAEIVRNLDWAQAPTTAPSAASTPGATDSGPTTGPVIAPPHRGEEPPVEAEPGLRTTFATLQVPRWDGEPERPVSEGVDKATVLDALGIGHYPGTVMPGAIGNFALAGHRTTYAKPFNRVAELQLGDPIVIRTASTWYVYRVTSTQIVNPQDVAVIAPVPGKPGVNPTERSITLTTCHPMFSARERFIVHGVLDYWAPVSDGVPAEIAGGA
ncbi:MAG: class E sortase [Cellulomonas sp.]